MFKSRRLPSFLIEGKVDEELEDFTDDFGQPDLDAIVRACVDRLDPHPDLEERVLKTARKACERIGFPMGEHAEFDLYPWLAPQIFHERVVRDVYSGESREPGEARVAFVSVHHDKRGVAEYVYRTLERLEPEAVCLETSPAGLETAFHYTLSPLPHAGIEVMARVPTKMLMGPFRDLYGALVYCLREGVPAIPVDVPSSLKLKESRKNPECLRDPIVFEYTSEVERVLGPTGELFFREYEEVEPVLRRLGGEIRTNVSLVASETFVRFHLEFRERYMLSRIADVTEDFDRVAVVVGAVHTSAMERAWREGEFRYLEPSPEDFKGVEWELSPRYKRHKLVVGGRRR
ncbi:hypothetical protein [Methanopyrus kandleri]|uniref:Uncharacterized protein n=2 Tax=Methanopyrus kandleri TaxID=2320 RepID=Q8TVG8_METKA|nr:hypothetical protein [Methanopyrus kandleri]AAM02634.1 Uncharacterized protein MK1421 [Methanopyrus kandleri AV19]HII70247.1 hypothetical protein [Methanopyrus kandleri]